MARITKSLRGESVNFDLFEIKNQILQSPANDKVKAREKFINKKKRRNTRPKVNEMLAQQKATEHAVALTVKAHEDNKIVIEGMDAVTPEPVVEPATTEEAPKRKVLRKRA